MELRRIHTPWRKDEVFHAVDGDLCTAFGNLNQVEEFVNDKKFNFSTLAIKDEYTLTIEFDSFEQLKLDNPELFL